ncbi:MAG: GH3 auxin-responsive promoter family protein [Oligoflexales bacterium]
MIQQKQLKKYAHEVSQKLIHRTSHFSKIPKLNKLVGTKHLEKVQTWILNRQLKQFKQTPWGKRHLSQCYSYETFKNTCPETSYSDWKELIEKQRNLRQEVFSPKVQRYVPTSGSSDLIKWIPYTKLFNQELQSALSSWLANIAILYPKTCQGSHYWSLSWLPDSLRINGETTDDSQVLSKLSRFLYKQIMAVPSEVGQLPSCRDTRFASAIYLCACQSLSVVSFWSPTLGLELLQDIIAHKETIADILGGGSWNYPVPAPRSPRNASILRTWNSGEAPQELFRALWPKLSLVSAWDTGSSRIWAEKLKRLLAPANFQGKGLWATEGVVSIPINGCNVLAATSHFYEFKLISTGEIIPSWQLETGVEVQPILTTGSGLLRYQLFDKMVCRGFLGALPKLEFMGRLGGIDMVGEKLDYSHVGKYLNILRGNGIPALSLIGVNRKNPHYILLIKREIDLATNNSIRSETENFLRQSHHYALAQDMGQLGSLEVIGSQDALGYYHGLFTKPRGQIKIEDLALAQ